MDPIDAALAALESLKLRESPNYTQGYVEQRHLNAAQELQLIQYIDGLSKRGLPPTREMIRNFASNIARKYVGKCWADRFIEQHKLDLLSRWTSGKDSNRHKADSSAKYRLYVDLLQQKIEQYNVEPRHTYNMDEKGFLIGVLSKMKRVFSRRRYESGEMKTLLQDGNREWITLLACICAGGSALTPALIYQAASGNIQDSWLQDFDPSLHKCFFTSSLSGWTSNDIGLAWLQQVFDRETKIKARLQYQLLILNGHGSHVTIDFINFCDKNKILLAVFPPHSTHTLQPLNVVMFSPLAGAYSKVLADFMDMCQGLSSITKCDFFRLFYIAWDVSFHSKSILKSFQCTGLSPFDPQQILARYASADATRPSSSDSITSVISASDWRKIERLLRVVSTLWLFKLPYYNTRMSGSAKRSPTRRSVGSEEETQATKAYIDEMLGKGFIRPSTSPYASPVLVVKKTRGGLRICVDYRGLNAVTRKNRNAPPAIKETLARMAKVQIMTLVDVIAAFNSVRIKHGDEEKTAFLIRYGLYEYLVMPFGLCNAPGTFQTFINETLHDHLNVICTAYLDDVLIYSDDESKHEQHVLTVLGKISKAGMFLDAKKCSFSTKRVRYLGLILTTDSLEMDSKKIATVLEWQIPRSIKDVQAFLGFANFYRRFIKGFSYLTKSLTELTKADGKKAFPLTLDSPAVRSFQLVKDAFKAAGMLAHFDADLDTWLGTDASDFVTAAVLSQMHDGVLRPIAFLSHKMNPAECNYEIYDKELLAIVRAFEEWRFELAGTVDPVKVLSDHQALQTFMTTKRLNRRQARWAEFLSEFNFNITYRPGKQGTKPDALTRRPGDLPEDADDDRRQHQWQIVIKPYQVDPALRVVALTSRQDPHQPYGMAASPTRSGIRTVGRRLLEHTRDTWWKDKSSRLSAWYTQWQLPYDTRRTPAALWLPRRILAKVLMIRSTHGDFEWYHRKFNHEDTSECPCGRPKTPEHLVFCKRATTHFKKWPLRPIVPPRTRQEGLAYLAQLIDQPQEFETFVKVTNSFYDE
ncbi:hypothetical protein PtrM4_077860 [Pyrenophora tritici-repentis]|uniref:Reverse transcriptase n=1 Tax=Pyrenophora tritici-repentis TaxID=45151 RepID=A0A834RZS7_9PLEO|nr:hypothetical protein PtrM4_077860 [Pyrenophora tritici-repentis]